ncbi:MAG: energy transducer TonB [Elusimicrobia bacterium]|nr:energy transducer TonB [Elusimicrobiota bacterium]
MVLHLAAGFAWLQVNKPVKGGPQRVIGNVDLMIRVRTPVATPLQPAAKPPPMSTWNFLKLALPSIPKVAAPLDVVKPVETKKALLDVPDKLDDKGRLEKLAKVDPLDLGRKRTAAAALDVAKLEAATRRSLPADMPKLEEVGTRKAAPKVLAMAAALEEENRGRLQPQGMDALSKLPAEKRAAPQVAPLLPEERAPAQKKTVLGRMADMLTSEAAPLPMQASGPPPAMERPKPRLDALKQTLPRQEQGAIVEKKKAMEIEGPLASRRLVYYEVPAFPDWLGSQGVGEAEVRIKFYVDAAGEVLPDIRIETTSGYGRLDRLAIESLRKWKFEPASGAGRQWGIITFRFLSE